MLLSLTRCGLCFSSLFCLCGCSVRSFVLSLCVWGLSVPCFSKAFRSLITLVCSLLDPSALFDHRRGQTNPTLIPSITRFTDHPLKSIRSPRSLTTNFQVRSRHAELLLSDHPQTVRQCPAAPLVRFPPQLNRLIYFGCTTKQCPPKIL